MYLQIIIDKALCKFRLFSNQPTMRHFSFTIQNLAVAE